MLVCCPACQQELPRDSQFCGFCGFRLGPITGDIRRSILDSASMAAAVAVDAADEFSRERAAPTGDIVSAEPVPIGAIEPNAAGAEGAATPQLAGAGLESTGASGRRFQRFPFRLEIRYQGEHRSYTGVGENMSLGGLFVATQLPADLGDLLELTFHIPGLDRLVDVTCRVRWIRSYEPDQPEVPPGLGVEFYGLNADVSEAITIFVHNREGTFFEA